MVLVQTLKRQIASRRARVAAVPAEAIEGCREKDGVVGGFCARFTGLAEVDGVSQVREEVSHIQHGIPRTGLLKVHKRHLVVRECEHLVIVEIVVGSVRWSPGLDERIQ